MKNKQTKDAKFLFRQAYDYMVTRIERGEWKAHDKLPSIRLLAQELRIHRLTVFRAYQMLKQNEKAYVKEKSGYYVSPVSTEYVVSEHTEGHPITASGNLKNSLSEIQQISVVYQFSQALIDPNLLPNLYLSEHVKKVFDIYPKLMGTYSSAQGDEELREFLCGYMYRHHSLQLTVNDLLITTGGQQAIDLISRVYIRPMDAILVERPTYSAALDIFRQQGARFIPVDIYPDGYDLEKVEMLMLQHRPRIFYMNPTFHNPTGYTVPAAQRKQLVELAERYRCLLVEDDAIHEMYFDQPPPQPMITYDTDGWVVYLRSFSKYVAPGLRICTVIGQPSVIRPLITAKSLADNGTPLVNQKIFLHYFKSERMKQHLEKLRIALQIRKEIVEEELTTTEWKWVSPKGGFNLWLKLPEALPVEEFLDECVRQSISFVPGMICDPLRELRSWIRLSYSFINEGQLRDGVRRLTEIAQRYKE
ncbi:DNA-binding transcriptional regulator, MocR family, contains an aminotransferase domain [Paenibacillus sp. yr247]|uniref:aminotransferase-like domain-containing protein n=1 Tax=Paenibacillus sp. yr247 TaxID=1761880 RepID=UPI00088939C6|nr:PLP-dependent aminotransferase family protein [Paenibacillus sp. yr247]SDN04247.1 DNA-binding transcriptional regulator, MocR family, contains an aminotransferase domain [Paenibacillus sp. yr247]